MDDTTYFENTVEAQMTLNAGRKEQIAVCCALSLLGILAAIIPGLGVFEIGLTFSLMMEMLGPELPGEAIPINVIIMSLATIVGIIGFHVLKHKKPDHPALKALVALAPFAVLLFFLGMMIAMAMSDLAGPADATINFNDDAMFDEPGAAEESGLSYYLMSFANLLSGLGLAGLIIVNLIVIHFLADYIRSRLPGLLERLLIALDKIKTAKRYLKEIVVLGGVTRELTELDKTKPQDLALTSAAEIEAAAAPVLRDLNKLVKRLQANQPVKTSPFARRDKKLPHPLPDVAEIEQFMAELQADLAALPDDLKTIFENDHRS